MLKIKTSKKAVEDMQSAIEAALDARGFRTGPTIGGATKCAEGVYLVAYESRNPSLVFVPDPCKRGRFCRVPRHFLYRSCPACNALPGQPCHNPNHGTSWSGASGHGDRGPGRGKYESGRPQEQYDDVVIEQALLKFAKLLTSTGYNMGTHHLPGCASLPVRKKKVPCDCGQDDRQKQLAKVIHHLPNLKGLDDVEERHK